MNDGQLELDEQRIYVSARWALWVNFSIFAHVGTFDL